MIRFAAVLAVLMIAGQAQALSCLRPNMGNGFNWAVDRGDSFVVAFGQVSGLSELPELDNANELRAVKQPVPKSYSGEMTGRFLSQKGLGPEYTFDIKIRETCISAWCGSPPEQDRDVVMIMQVVDAISVLEATPCQTSYQYEPNAVVQQTLEKCMAFGRCNDQQIMGLLE